VYASSRVEFSWIRTLDQNQDHPSRYLGICAHPHYSKLNNKNCVDNVIVTGIPESLSVCLGALVRSVSVWSFWTFIDDKGYSIPF
jgi:hypothetical protein